MKSHRFCFCILDKTELQQVAIKFKTTRFSDNFPLLKAWFVPSKFFMDSVKHVENNARETSLNVLSGSELKKRTQWSYQFQMFWSLRTLFSKLCFYKNQLLFVPSSVYAPPGQKASSDACASCSFSIFLPRILGRRRKWTPVNSAMNFTLFGFRGKKSLIKKTERFSKNTFSPVKNPGTFT